MHCIPIEFKLIHGTFIRRLNRFLALAEVEGRHVHVHLPNSGRLTTILYPGVKLYLREPKTSHLRKSPYSIFAAIHDNNTSIIVDSLFSNYLARRVIELGLMDELAGYKIVGENIRLKGSRVRLDFLLRADSKRFYLEVKSVTHAVNDTALFPDAPTLRGRRQLTELLKLLEKGFRAGVIFSVQRPDAARIKPNYDIDPGFASLLRLLVENGLRVFTLKAAFTPSKDVILWPNEPQFTF